MLALLPAPTAAWQIVVRTWLPVVLLVAGYRLSGLFFVAPMKSVEQWLLAFDTRVFEAVGWKPRWTRAPVFRGALELAYLLVYAMVPLGVVALDPGGSVEPGVPGPGGGAHGLLRELRDAAVAPDAAASRRRGSSAGVSRVGSLLAIGRRSAG